MRLTLLRIVYLLNFLYLGAFVLRALIVHVGPWDPIRAVAYSSWGALALLSALGMRRPMAMLPVLVMQFVYKAIWLFGIYLPIGMTGSSLVPVMVTALVIDALVIPWPYVLSRYVLAEAKLGEGVFDHT